MSKKKEEIKRLEEAVRLAEKGGNFDTVHHDRLAKLTKDKKAAKTVDTSFTTKEQGDG